MARLVPAAASILLAGCAMAPQLQRVAVDHNQMVAEAEDELTLLNIVRASERFPLHFTSFSEVNGNASVSMSTSLGAALKPGDDTYSPSTSASVSTSPSFKLGVLATEKFQRGIQQPISADLVAYYLDAGWRDPLIMSLLIESVDIVQDGERRKIVNEFNTGEFVAFMCAYEMVAVPASDTPALVSVGELLDSAKIGGAASASDKRKEVTEFLALLGRDDLLQDRGNLYAKALGKPIGFRRLDQPRCTGGNVSPPSGDGEKVEPHFRSTLGVIYFLGEYLRESQRPNGGSVYGIPFEDKRCESWRLRRLIDIRTGSGPAKLDTTFQKLRYFVPDVETDDCGARMAPGRTMQVISIVQQLLNLHKSAEDLPRSISVSGGN